MLYQILRKWKQRLQYIWTISYKSISYHNLISLKGCRLKVLIQNYVSRHFYNTLDKLLASSRIKITKYKLIFYLVEQFYLEFLPKLAYFVFRSYFKTTFIYLVFNYGYIFTDIFLRKHILRSIGAFGAQTHIIKSILLDSSVHL